MLYLDLAYNNLTFGGIKSILSDNVRSFIVTSTIESINVAKNNPSDEQDKSLSILTMLKEARRVLLDEDGEFAKLMKESEAADSASSEPLNLHEDNTVPYAPPPDNSVDLPPLPSLQQDNVIPDAPPPDDSVYLPPLPPPEQYLKTPPPALIKPQSDENSGYCKVGYDCADPPPTQHAFPVGRLFDGERYIEFDATLVDKNLIFFVENFSLERKFEKMLQNGIYTLIELLSLPFSVVSSELQFTEREIEGYREGILYVDKLLSEEQ